jgi:signal transduction histidine kinase
MQRLRCSVASLRGRLLLLVLLSALLPLGLALFGYVEQRNRATVQAESEALRLARLVAADQRRVIDQARLVLTMLAALPEVRGRDSAACNALMVRLRDELGSFQSLGVIDRNGTIVCSSLPTALSLAVADRTYVGRAASLRGFAVGDYQIGRASQTANVNFGYPLFDDDGSLIAVVYASLNLDWLNRYAAEAQLPPEGTLTVVDAGGTILARQPEPERWVGRSATDAPLMAGLLARDAEGMAEGADVDGVQRLFAFVPLRTAPEATHASLIVGIPAAVAYAAADRDLWRSLAALTATGLVVLALARLGANRLIVRPVQALVIATRRLSRGDLGARTGLRPGADEIGQLGRAFDEMAGALQAADARRAEDERLRREKDELEQQHRAVQEANRLKSELISIVSHEMRTPLTSIQGYVHLLLEGASGPLPDEQRKFLTIVYDNSVRLLSLINDLLDLARIEAGRLDLHQGAVDLAAAIQAVADDLRPLLRAKSQTIALDLPDDLPAVWADHDRAIQILTNLISNAHKYTPDGGHIAVSARADGDHVAVGVRDDGIGLSDAEQAQLFTRFFRASNATVRRTSGTGLGLAITHSLVELHGGQLRVVSAPGQGSTFSFTLPLAPSEPARPAPSEQLSVRR